jgi:hypothetical protein
MIRCRSLAAAAAFGWLAHGVLACTSEMGGGTGQATGSEPGGAAAPPGDATAADDGTTPVAVDGLVPVDRPGFEPVAPLARRLTHEEYENTLADILGVTLTDEELRALPVDRPLEGFVNIASSQATLPDHVRAYDSLASIAVSRMDFDGFLVAHAACRDASDACRSAFVNSAGGLLFRRPLAERESAAYSALFTTVEGLGGDFTEGARAVVQALLQSPEFLYLLEIEKTGTPGLRQVTSYEMASRLSYALWASAPDAPLLEQAAGGGLDSADGVANAVERMLLDERAHRITERFLVDWARMDSTPDDDGLRAELIASAVAFYQDHVWDRGAPLFEMFSAPRAFLTPTLAERYGLEAQGDGIREYDLTNRAGRLGILTQPGVVAGMTNADGGAIVARGLFLMSQVFCGEAPDFPSNLQSTIDEFVASLPEDASDREVSAVRLQRAQCAGCHGTFDPLAYGFEQLDFRGRYRESDEFGNELLTDGWIPASYTSGEEVSYTSLDDYLPALARMPRVQECFVRKHLEYALGRVLGAEHEPSIAAVAESFTAGGGDYYAMAQAVTSHDLFRVTPME